MLTAQQFSQLAAAAWSAAPAARICSIEYYTDEAGSYTATTYNVSYHVGSGPGARLFLVSGVCPFTAVAGAVAKAAAAGVPVCRHHAQQVIARTAAALCGVQFGRPGFANRARARRVAPLFRG